MTGAEDGSLTRDERKYRNRLWFHALLSLGFLVGYLIGGANDLGYIPNSVGKDALFVVVSVVAALHVRRHGWLVLVIALGYVGLILGQAWSLARGGFPDVEILGVEIHARVALLGWMAVDIWLTWWLLRWWFRAERSRWQLGYLHPLAFLSLISLGEVLIKGRREVVPPLEIARNVDGYLSRLKSRSKRKIQWALAALVPFRALRPELRERVLEGLFIHAVGRRRLPGIVRPVIRAAIRVSSQMAYLGYYGDRRSWREIHYAPYSARRHRSQAPPTHIGESLKALKAPPRHKRYDAIVVGSGAAGGILAYRWAAAGSSVLVLERGPYADPRKFTEDEVEQYLTLYNEGALQLAANFSLSLLQGMCVGGGTTVNNALCLRPPDAVVAAWERQHGVDAVGLRAAIDQVHDWMLVDTIPDSALSSSARLFAQAARRMHLAGSVELMEANILGSCRGCGYCNIGCPFGAKVSMLDAVLPEAHRRYGVDVLPDFEVERIVYDGDRAIAVEGRHHGGGLVHIPAKEHIVVAAGAVHSSGLLQRSGIAPGRAGNGLHFNINSPLTAEFRQRVNSHDGIQMAYAHIPHGDVPPFMLETWFNPPATQALAMPGWFERHFRNMHRYAHMASVGALTGTTTPGTVRSTRSGPVFDYTPSPDDLRRVVEGLKLATEIFFEAGARRVMPATYLWHEFRPGDRLDVLDRYVRDSGDLQLTSAHPQGGNPIGEREAGAVVAPDFRVHGFENLYLCDASVFPSSVGVNPQLTVMGLAQHAANLTLGEADEPPLQIAA